MRRVAGLLLLALVASACNDGFDPKSRLVAYRVLGIQADPAEVGPDDSVTLRAFEYVPEAESGPAGEAFYIWAVCLYSLGAVAQYDCVDPRLERYLSTDEPTLTIDFGPAGMNLRALFALFGDQFRGLGGERLSLEEGITVWVKLYSGRVGGGHMDSVKRVRVRAAPPAELNHNPRAVRILIGGRDDVLAVPAGSALPVRVEIDPESIEQTVDEVTGEVGPEELLYAWYSTAGTLDGDLGVANGTEATLTFPDVPGPMWIYVAVRDGRGGLDLLRYPPFPDEGQPERSPLMVTELLESP